MDNTKTRHHSNRHSRCITHLMISLRSIIPPNPKPFGPNTQYTSLYTSQFNQSNPPIYESPYDHSVKYDHPGGYFDGNYGPGGLNLVLICMRNDPKMATVCMGRMMGVMGIMKGFMLTKEAHSRTGLGQRFPSRRLGQVLMILAGGLGILLLQGMSCQHCRVEGCTELSY